MKTDGTAAGTTVVKDFTPGNASSSLEQLTRVGSLIYFVQENDLWKTDGTDAGTVKVFTRNTEDFPFSKLTGVGIRSFCRRHQRRMARSSGRVTARLRGP